MRKKNITAITEYKIYHVDMKPVLKQKNISQNDLCRMTDTSFSTLQKYFAGKVKRIDLDVISRICEALDCEITDILKR